MNLATWGIRNPIPVVLLFLLLAMAGMRGFLQLPIQDLPDLELPVVNIVLEQPGAAPAQLETEVARKVEESVADVVGVRHLRTTVTDGTVRVSVEFEIGTPLSEALADTKEAVDRIRSDLPEDVLQASVSAEPINGEPILTYAVNSPQMDEEALSWLVDDSVSKRLNALPGVGRVERVGGVEREVLIEIDPTRLDAIGITAADVSRTLSQLHRDASGGRARIGGAEQSVRTMVTVPQAAGLGNLPIAVDGARHVRLADIATITDGHADRSQTALLDGRTVVGFRIYRARGQDETVIAEQAARVLAELSQARPGLRFTLVHGSVAHTREQFQGSMQMLLEGALLAILVVWWFLRDWRATAVAATALPLSILPVFALMAWVGYSLNTLTLLALAVTTGILVDDAIVEIENIERHRRLGKSIRTATGDAVTEIALPVLATTFTLVVVFVPTTMMPGVPGLLFAQFGWTAVIAILASLLVARLLTPLLAVHWLDAAPAKASPPSRWMDRYLAIVGWSLAHRKSTVALVAAFLVGSAGLLPLLSTGFLPASDQGFVRVGVELPPGTSLQASFRTVERVRSEVADLPGMSHVFAVLGEPGGDSGQSVLTLVLEPRGERPSQKDIEQAVLARLAGVPGARFTLGSGNGDGALSLILAGNDARVLKATAHTLERQMRALPGLTGVRSTANLERPALTIRPDMQRAAELGVSTTAIAETVRIATLGDFDVRLPKLNLDNRQLAVRVRLPDAVRSDLHRLRNLRVPALAGTVPVGNVASLTIEGSPQQIDRYDRQRYVTVNAGLGNIPLGDATATVASLPIMQSLPAGVRVMPAGDSELATELAEGFATALVTGLSCMFCVLVLLFKDVFQPVTILSAVPLSIGGALLALLLGGSSLNVPALIGLVMLMGIVAKNSILLVEYTVLRIRGGSARNEALLDACRARARPIVMTTLAMVAGMLPIALGLGADASFRQPMAITVIGGLVTSTALSLLVVPVVFTGLDDANRWCARTWKKRAGTRLHPGESA